jgi:hypothetical protein
MSSQASFIAVFDTAQNRNKDINRPARRSMASQHFSQQQQYVAQQGMIYAALALVTGTLPMTIYFQELLDRPPNATGRYEVVEQVQLP